MALKSIVLVNFRSYGAAEFDLSDQLNLIIGPNGAGKTNLLEAIYTLANTRSWRTKDQHLVKKGAAGFHLQGDLEAKQLGLDFKSKNDVNQKTATLNQNSLAPADYLSYLQTVLFEPGSLSIITGEPQARRRYLNQALAAANNEYLKQLLKYQRILAQRNHLLRSRAPNIKDQVFAWDIGLSQAGAYLVGKRRDFVDYLDKHLAGIYQELSGQPAKLNVTYLSEATNSSGFRDYATSFLGTLERNLEADLRRGFTMLGPHRDDTGFVFDGDIANRVASRGETRTLVLALKLAEYDYLKQHKPTGDMVLLFDDIFSELDVGRRQFTLRHLKDTQVLITTTDIKGLSKSLPLGHRIIKLGK